MNASMMKDVRQWVLTLAIAAVMAVGATVATLEILDSGNTASPSLQYIDHNSGSNGGG